MARIPFTEIVGVRCDSCDSRRSHDRIQINNWVDERWIVAYSPTYWPAIVSAPHDNVDLVVGGGSSFGSDEPVVRRVEVKPESIANSPSVYATTWDGIVVGDRTVRRHSKHLTIGRSEERRVGKGSR